MIVVFEEMALNGGSVVCFGAAGEVEKERRPIVSLYPAAYALPAFEEAVQTAALPLANEVVSACNDFAHAMFEEKRLPEGITEEDAKFIALHTFDYGEGAPEREHNPCSVLNEALNHRTVLALRRARHVLWGLLSALRKLPHTEYPVLYCSSTKQVSAEDPMFAKGSLIRWPCFASATPSAPKGDDHHTVFVVRGAQGFKVWGYDISPFSFLSCVDGEVLLEPDLCFRVLSATTGSDGRVTVELEVDGETSMLLGDRIYGTQAMRDQEKAANEEEEKRKKAEAFAKLKEAADGGDLEAMVALAGCYANGEGVERDDKKTVELYTLAMDKGSADATYKLGWCYDTGFGVAQDVPKAVELYQKAADNGSVPAMFNVAVCYYNGDGTKQDQKKAVEMYQRAADAGHAKAMKNLAVCYSKGTGVPQDDKKAVEYWKRAADTGDSGAMFDLALCYEKGTGVEKDQQKAIVLFQSAADLDNVNALFNLGVCYDNGDGVPQDKNKALELFRRAAALGDFEALQRIQMANPSCCIM